jgi:hypothetical protein
MTLLDKWFITVVCVFALGIALENFLKERKAYGDTRNLFKHKLVNWLFYILFPLMGIVLGVGIWFLPPS